YQHAAIPFPSNFRLYQENYPSYLYPFHRFFGDSAAMDQNIRDYYETAHAAEYSVDSILGYLESQNILDSTIVIFTNDNGFFLGEHYLTRKQLAYEESMRVPLF